MGNYNLNIELKFYQYDILTDVYDILYHNRSNNFWIQIWL